MRHRLHDGRGVAMGDWPFTSDAARRPDLVGAIARAEALLAKGAKKNRWDLPSTT